MIWFEKLKKSYPQIFVEQWTYKEKEREKVSFINEEIESFSDDDKGSDGEGFE